MSLGRFDPSIVTVKRSFLVNQIVGWPCQSFFRSYAYDFRLNCIPLSSITIIYCFRVYYNLLEIKFPMYYHDYFEFMMAQNVHGRRDV